MKLFLGIDGGQSSTTAIAGDEHGRIAGIGRAGPCNHARAAEGREKFRRAISESVHAAVESSGARFECACFGLSGGPEDKEALAREIVGANRYIFTHDAEIALAGATAGEPGLIAIAGTGSIAFGKNNAGRTARAGGWGYIFGDEGSGFDLVRQSLRAALRFDEGWGAPTRLRDALLESAGARDANDLLHRFYTGDFPRDRIASLARVVDQVAIAGDPIAREILNSAAQSLATFVSAVRPQIFTAGETVQVSFTGGVFRSRLLLERYRALIELDEACRVTPPQYGPAAGALILAYRTAGIMCELSGAPEEKF